jgi:hypothetical protein
MPISEFIVESWRLVMYVFLAFIFVINLLYAWHNYDEAMDYAMDVREARMNAVALLNKWGDSGVISASSTSPEDLSIDAVARLYRADGTLVKEVLRSPGPGGESMVRIRVPVVIDGQEGYMVYEERI